MVLENKFIKVGLFAALFVSFLVSINIGVRRFNFEEQNNKVEVAVSYNAIKRLSIRGGSIETNTLLERLKKESGITSVALEEDTLEYFVNEGKVTVLKGSEIMNMYRVGHVNRYLLTHLYKQIKVKPDRFYLIIDEKSDYEQIRDFLNVEFGKDNVRRVGSLNILEVVDDRDDLMQLGLGVSKQHIKDVLALGLRPIIRLKNSNRLSTSAIKQKILSFVSEVPEATIIFEGKTVLGYPSQIEYLQEKVKDNDLKIGIVEFSSQLGDHNLAKGLPEHVLRVHSIGEDELRYMPAKKAKARYLRAAKERGIKILFVYPYFQVFEDTPIVEFNIAFIKDITEGLEVFGFEVAPVLELPVDSYHSAKKWEIFLLSLGVLTTILFLIHYYIPLSLLRTSIIYIGFILSFYACLKFNLLTSWNQAMAVMVAVLFPSLAVISQFPTEQDLIRNKGRFLSAILYFLKLLGMCMVGAFLIVGFLSDIKFVFGIERFAGVKISFILPLIFVSIYFYLRPHRITSMFFILKRLFYSPVRTVGLLAITVFFASVLVLVLRSGNYIPMPSIFLEERFRAWLEAVLLVRPRTKEFLIGYPFLLFAYMKIDKELSRQWLWFFNVIGTVALISVVNSFCHVHTPLSISIYRTVLGMLLGFVIGHIYIIVFNGLQRLFKSRTHA